MGMNRALSIAIASLGLVACSPPEGGDVQDPLNEAATGDNGMHGAHEPHLFFARGAGGSRGPSPLTLHGGNILTTTNIYAIWWGNWPDTTSPDIQAGIEGLFQGYAGSSYANTITEYYDCGGQPCTSTNKEFVSGQSVFKGSLSDTSAAPAHALSTTGAVTEVCKVLGQNSLTPDSNTVYFIYTSTGAGRVSYCAWHSWGSCNGVPVQVAYMPNLDGVAGCNPLDTYVPSDGHSEGLAALANVTAHELSEAITDPQGTGWIDGNGQEVGDKCAWKFSAPVSLTANGKTTTWKLQEEWSDAAGGCIQTK
jgi:hypothetical protein